MGWGNKSLFIMSGSHDQNGHHAHIWLNPLNIFFSGTEWPLTLELSIHHKILGLKIFFSGLERSPWYAALGILAQKRLFKW